MYDTSLAGFQVWKAMDKEMGPIIDEAEVGLKKPLKNHNLVKPLIRTAGSIAIALGLAGCFGVSGPQPTQAPTRTVQPTPTLRPIETRDPNKPFVLVIAPKGGLTSACGGIDSDWLFGNVGNELRLLNGSIVCSEVDGMYGCQALSPLRVDNQGYDGNGCFIASFSMEP